VAQKYVIVHGHFYQPPRENPWIDRIETQPSAAPYRNWNELVYDQCYRPNAFSRLLDQHGAISDIHNNFLNMSFNFGPTLFSWLEHHHIGTARRIVEADLESCNRFENHGNAIAQVYNHLIMPLASVRDQLTQIRWTKRYFRDRFKRDPEGIWLAETAINMDTVNCCIRENIRFVVLAPSQAEALRPLDGGAGWTPVPPLGPDTRCTYRIFPTDKAGNRLPGFLDVFFFDTALSREASFGDLLKDAHSLGSRINALYDRRSALDQVVTLATDGETFGHHKPFGDMCLAYFFQKIAPKFEIFPVNFGYFLAKNPPRQEVLIKNAFGEGSAWSCAHGVGRWTCDCGCKTGGKPGWKQSWRTPLRNVLTTLKEHVDREYETALSKSGIDPWILRDEYITVMDDASIDSFCSFLRRTFGRGVDCSRENALAVRKLVEAQKYMQFSFTSCGWFFSDISGIETMQNLSYAGRAIQLGIPLQTRETVFQEFLAGLANARSNLPATTGRSLFEKEILPFLQHEKIIAFTAVVEKIIKMVRTDKMRLFGYELRMRELCSLESGLLSYHGYEVELENEQAGEKSVWAVLLSHREWAEVRGWVVAADAIGNTLTGSVEPEAWMRCPDAAVLTLNHVFQSSRETLADYMHQNIFRDTYAKFSAWMRKNEQELDFLSRLNFPVPPYCMAPMSFVYNQQWNHLVRGLEQRGSEEELSTGLRDLYKMAEQYAIVIDLKECAGLLERIIIMELSALSMKLSAETCERIGNLLAIVDRFSIPVSKNKMEDAFCPILIGPIRVLSGEVERLDGMADRTAELQRLLAEKRSLLITLVNFSRRMNFTTDSFQTK
jgi:alpha-amylase/alpha-mannosidase (GH57 family)